LKKIKFKNVTPNSNQEPITVDKISDENIKSCVSTVSHPIKDQSNALKILIVDDSLLVQKSLKRWLEAHGCVVTLVSNGKVGLKLMREERFDITLMDFLMVRVLLHLLLTDATDANTSAYYSR
jgi:PleD family two-component response regulator